MPHKSDSKFLLSEHPINVYPSLAKALGSSDRAIVLQQIRFWMHINAKDPAKRKTHFIDDRWWTYNTFNEWQETFCWLSLRTIKRIFKWLEDEGLIIQEHFHHDPRNRTSWYTIDFDAVDSYCNSSNQSNNASNPCSERKCQFGTMEDVSLAQSEVSIWHDDLYTETTNRDFLQRLSNIDKRHSDGMTLSINDASLLENSNQQANSSTVVVKQENQCNATVENKTSEQDKFSANLPKKKKDKFEYDDLGYIRLPCNGKDGRAGTLALKSMQLLIASVSGCLRAISDGDRVYLQDPNSGSWHIEDYWFKRVPLAVMKNDAEKFDQCGLYQTSPTQFNDEVLRWFDYWKGRDKRRTYSVFDELVNEGELDTIVCPVDWCDVEDLDIDDAA